MECKVTQINEGIEILTDEMIDRVSGADNELYNATRQLGIDTMNAFQDWFDAQPYAYLVYQHWR